MACECNNPVTQDVTPSSFQIMPMTQDEILRVYNIKTGIEADMDDAHDVGITWLGLSDCRLLALRQIDAYIREIERYRDMPVMPIFGQPDL